MGLFLFDFHSIDLINLQMQQISFTHQRNHFRRVVIAGYDHLLRYNPSLLRDKTNKYLLALLWMDIKLNRVDHEVSKLQKVSALLCIILLIMAEESVSSLAAFVRESEDHIRTIAKPAILAFQF